MKKIVLLLVLFLSANFVYGADEWAKNEPLGARVAADIDDYIAVNNEALDRLLSNYQTVYLHYASASTVEVTAGEVVCTNSAGDTRKFRKNTSGSTLTWSNLDAGAETTSTTYYVYALADADATTFTLSVSTSSSAPSGATYYKNIGRFYNNSSGDIEQVYDGLKTKMLMGSGTIANGATIPLPTGYAASQCYWIVSTYSQYFGDDEFGTATYYCYADSNRLVTQSWKGDTTNAYVNYLIIGYSNYN